MQRENQSDEEEFHDRPWEESGRVRRDCEPHRAEFLSLLGVVALLLSALAMLVWPLIILALPLCITLFVLTTSDLQQIDAGLVDPLGRQGTRDARLWAIAGMVLNIGGLLGAGLMLLLHLR